MFNYDMIIINYISNYIKDLRIELKQAIEVNNQALIVNCKQQIAESKLELMRLKRKYKEANND